jgi:hypothetical protein
MRSADSLRMYSLNLGRGTSNSMGTMSGMCREMRLAEISIDSLFTVAVYCSVVSSISLFSLTGDLFKVRVKARCFKR